MTASSTTTPSRARGPRLGVSRVQRVRTAGGLVGQWWTPPWLAALLVRWMGLDVPRVIDATPRPRPWRVLDAGAGQGALSIAALDVGCEVVAVERDPRLVLRLERTLGHRMAVRELDFLARDTRQEALPLGEQLRGFDVCLTNPPLGGRPRRALRAARAQAGGSRRPDRAPQPPLRRQASRLVAVHRAGALSSHLAAAALPRHAGRHARRRPLLLRPRTSRSSTPFLLEVG